LAVTNLADHAAAVTAGWGRAQLDRGAGKSPRFSSSYQKPLIGSTRESGFLALIEGTGDDSSQANADTNALTSLNAFRRARYGGSSGRASGDANSNDIFGNALTVDVS
jgi:hypothetical protein